MHKKVLAVLSLLMVLALSGCLEVSQQVWHNPDGSGKIVIEIALAEDMLTYMGYEGSPEENREEILREMAFAPDDLPSDPNIRNVSINSFYDPDEENFRIIMEIELFDLAKGWSDEDDIEVDIFDFTITDNFDGTYRFSLIIDASSGLFAGELDQMSQMMFEPFFEGKLYTLQLNVGELIDADPQAVYDRSRGTITWEMPMVEMMTLSAPVEFWAVYRAETSRTLPNIHMGGFPAWVPVVLLCLCCLALLIMIIIVVVVVLLVRKQKKNKVQPEPLQPEETAG